MKTCTKCKIIKPTDDFGKHKARKGGFTQTCKMCNAAAYGVREKEGDMTPVVIGGSVIYLDVDFFRKGYIMMSSAWNLILLARLHMLNGGVNTVIPTSKDD